LSKNGNIAAAIACARQNDIVVLFGLQGSSALIAGSAATILRRPIIAVTQSLPVEYERRRALWIRAAKMPLLKACTWHIYQSPVSRDVLIDVYGLNPIRMSYAPFEAGASIFDQLLKLPNPTFPQEFELLKSRGFSVNGLFVGNLHRFKGVDDFLYALSRTSNVGAVFIGPADPPSRKTELMETANSLGISQRVVFSEPKFGPDLAAMYRAADFVTLPTHKDCFPKVLVEGALAGKPLLTTDASGAVGAVVIDGSNGFVIKPGDIDALTGSINKLKSADLRIRFGEFGRNLVTQFCNPQVEVSGYIEAIESVANQMNNS
jgi:glycosyltransferase involved in cell wall biosynthesis